MVIAIDSPGTTRSHTIARSVAGARTDSRAARRWYCSMATSTTRSVSDARAADRYSADSITAATVCTPRSPPAGRSSASPPQPPTAGRWP